MAAQKEFDRLYEMGGNSCPVLRCMAKSSKIQAAAIMDQCPVAMKFEPPKALTNGRGEDGSYDNYKKWE